MSEEIGISVSVRVPATWIPHLFTVTEQTNFGLTYRSYQLRPDVPDGFTLLDTEIYDTYTDKVTVTGDEAEIQWVGTANYGWNDDIEDACMKLAALDLPIYAVEDAKYEFIGMVRMFTPEHGWTESEHTETGPVLAEHEWQRLKESATDPVALVKAVGAHFEQVDKARYSAASLAHLPATPPATEEVPA